MKVIVAGSRSINHLSTVKDAIEQSEFPVDILISGGARGVDELGERWAKNNAVPIHVYPADWDKHGKGAGYVRNSKMAKVADALIAVWDGESRGTKHMIEEMWKATKPIYVYRTDGKENKRFVPFIPDPVFEELNK